MFNVYVVRYSEIGLKSNRLRLKWERVLMRNLEVQTGGKAFKRAARIILVGGDRNRVGKVFGVKSYSPAIEVPADIERIKNAALQLWRGENSFAVRAHRVTKDFPLNSLEINREVGAFIKEHTGMRVDLENPELTIGIEIIGKRAYIFRDVLPGPGGLPSGVSGDVVVLLSPGFDSPLAAWYVMRRGVRPHFLYAGMGAEGLIKNIVGRLSEWLPFTPPLYTYNHTKVLKELLPRLRHPGDICLACKAVMYVQAERLARKVHAHAIVTGEVIGQVASQTLENMAFLDSFVRVPVLRPLVGFDKDDIMKKVRELEMYDLLAKGSTIRCPYVPRKPATKPKSYIRGVISSLPLPEPEELDINI